jgi:tetratricopeptide (TPR) repeat protein
LVRAPANCQGERNFLLGEIALADGNTRSAISKYSQTIQIAQELNFNYEELLSRLALVCIYGSHGDFATAQEHLSRAQELISDKADRLVFRFREVLVLLWQGRYKPSHAMEELDSLIEAFGDMGLLQEQAAVKLHKADLIRKEGKSEFTVELDALQALSVTLQNPSFLAREWALLPDFQKIAQQTHPRIAGSTTTVLEVFTLGEERVTVDGNPLHIPLRRGVEVLAYLLEKKAVTLQDVMDDVFPNDNPRSAKSYFHQFRHQLREHLDGLEIEYDSESKMYRLTSEINVLWDVAELRSGRSMGSKGVFLPESKNQWAREVDAELEPYRSMKPGVPPPTVNHPTPNLPPAAMPGRAASSSQFYLYDDDGKLENDSEGDGSPRRVTNNT